MSNAYLYEEINVVLIQYVFPAPPWLITMHCIPTVESGIMEMYQG